LSAALIVETAGFGAGIGRREQRRHAVRAQHDRSLQLILRHHAWCDDRTENKNAQKTRSMFLEIQIETAEITQTGSGQTYGNSDANFCGLLSVGSHATIRLNDFYGQGTEADGACVHVHIKQQNGT
jgi:hypothetical protein